MQPASIRFPIVVIVVLLVAPVSAQPSASAPTAVDFVHDVQPILRRNCFRCHGAKTAEGGLQLDRREATLGVADSGEAILVKGRAAESLLIKRLTDESYGERMPLDGQPLSAAEIDVLRKWIDAGAPWPDDLAEATHWAYQPIRRPAVPAVADPRPDANPIDHFVMKRLEAAGLEPAPSADRPTLIRRVSLALVGLPPSPAEVDAFVSDPAPDAYAKVVDRLLASQRYGERWAVPWLDLARYADSNGYQADQIRDNWAYRDWVIRAFNADMPFDRFVVEQIAGDLLPEATLEQRVATGFHRMTTCNVEAGVHPEADRVNQVVDRVNTTATVFLGTTLECAQCHDHKYDPFTQQDYYRLFAYFNNTPLEVKNTAGVTWDFFGPTLELPTDQSREQKRQQLTVARQKLEARRANVAKLAQEGFDEWLESIRHSSAGNMPDVDAVIVALAVKDKRTGKETRTLRKAFEEENPQLVRLTRQISGLSRQIRELSPDTTLVMVEMDEPRETFVMLRGDYEQPGEKVSPGTPAALPAPGEIEPTGDRLELARWLVSRDNPLLARVTVNRWWGQLFGTPLVSTPEDFGAQGEAPSHPQLLDWLASELIDSGWSMKHVHRLIVTSATFGQSARVTPELLERDPDNRLLARGPRFRLAAELVRDNALAVSGLLSARMYGPPVMPYQPEGLWRSIGRNQPKWIAAEDGDRFRRGVYVVWKRAAPYPSFMNFDAPDRGSCTVKRPRTNTPLQALTLLNDPAYAEMALALADRVLSEAPQATDEARIDYALGLAVARRATPAEIELLGQVLATERAALAGDDEAVVARTQAPVKGMQLRTTDRPELAAWCAVANVLLNLDETMTQ